VYPRKNKKDLVKSSLSPFNAVGARRERRNTNPRGRARRPIEGGKGGNDVSHMVMKKAGVKRKRRERFVIVNHLIENY